MEKNINLSIFRGVEFTLGRKKREGDKLKKAARRLAPFAKDYAVFFEEKLNGN